MKFKGLDPETLYQLNGSDVHYYGDELMNKGLYIDPLSVDGHGEPMPLGDFRSEIIKLSKVLTD